MKAFLVALFVFHSTFATQKFNQNTPAHHLPTHYAHQNAPQNFASQQFASQQFADNQPENVRRGRYLADSVAIAVDPVYKTVYSPSSSWSPSWSASWPVADSGLFYGAHVASVPSWKYDAVPSWKKVESVPSWKVGEPVPSWKVAEPVPSWKVAEPVPSWKVAEPVPSWRVASYDSAWKVQPVGSWKIAPREDSWKIEKWGGDKWDGKWVADEKLWNSGWTSPSAVVPNGPSFYAGAPVSWSGPVIKKQWGYVENIPKAVPYYGAPAVEHGNPHLHKWVKPVENFYAEGAQYSSKPFQYSSTVVHEKPVAVQY